MKKIGLIGGMSWESTLLYYELINKKVKAILGGLHSSNCVIESVDFAEIAALQAIDDWDALDELMKTRARALESSGAEMILICANTMHLCVTAIEESIDIPVLHIAKVTADEIKKSQLDKVALLGTRFTMERDFYKDILKDHQIDVIVPEQNDRKLVNDIIYKELVRGVLKPESKEIYLGVIEDLRKRGAQGVILGCTEIPLLIYPEDVELPIFNTTKIHAEKAVELSLSNG
ncbi:aspartate/glutamate racemase family protein [Lutimonas vermicola]|uniref:Aspartate/glutamate racemase family protein n=1 Tax=Lutimonas vermicola TaxID=414288 RepID=A0ABU9L2J8_9FLAO